MEQVADLNIREINVRLQQSKMVLKQRQVEEDLYVTKIALKELKSKSNPLNNLLGGLFNAGGSAIKVLDRLGSQGQKSRKKKIGY